MNKTTKNVLVLMGILLFWGKIASGQTTTLAVGVASGRPGAVVRVPINLGSANNLAGIQWILKVPKTAPTTLAVGPASVVAGKDIYCASTTGTVISTICLLVGVNSNVFNNGVVAYVDVRLPASFGTIALGISETLGASLEANAITVAGVSGKVTKPLVSARIPSEREEKPVSKMEQGSEESEGASLTPSMEDMDCVWENSGLRCSIRLARPTEGGRWTTPFSSLDVFEKSERFWVEEGSTFFEVFFILIDSVTGQEPVVVSVKMGDDTMISIVTPPASR